MDLSFCLPCLGSPFCFFERIKSFRSHTRSHAQLLRRRKVSFNADNNSSHTQLLRRRKLSFNADNRVCMSAVISDGIGVREAQQEYQIGGTIFEGYFAYPKSSSKKLPGVLFLHDDKGHDNYVRKRAKMIAKLGYVGFACDLYGKGVYAEDVPTSMGPIREHAIRLSSEFLMTDSVKKARLKGCLRILQEHHGVDPKKIVIVGYGFGGIAALEIGRLGLAVSGIAVFHSSLAFNCTHDANKHIKAPVIVFTGMDDPFVPPAQVEAFEREMRAAKLDFQIVKFSNTRHRFTDPEQNLPDRGFQYNALSDKRSWEHLKAFIKECTAV
mmetsp:Transcript_40551/g.65771  ORF Transcript_40551/g.65771 Transcript_40551/m.65771 type:complete len:325 (-) Transcript_40551:196-1170(-)|eukprot:CAMPEP_0184349198 /NCGR_PEP_ID=MMETSP1089-20130417/32235_1 /TAXON_ID=38269 ORGANISM="Gloeochaete wittrockiana, Strain SAG46.84" /NCGR_SAMPLE_ID=MMETSP1089 /ASSEMBLY_ACC=CAM_ASM_000445 /LENGTH=324 /DNA_ID=CAMNT_0026681297 /DNA_START=16 /DNA_END=990 /DNA_ORIENTATION=-